MFSRENIGLNFLIMIVNVIVCDFFCLWSDLTFVTSSYDEEMDVKPTSDRLIDWLICQYWH